MKSYWSPKLINNDLSYRLLKAMLFKFFYEENIYRKSIFDKKTGKKTDKTELRFSYSGHFIFVEKKNVYQISRNFLLSEEIIDINMLMFRPNDTEKFIVNKHKLSNLRCLKGSELRRFFHIKIDQSKNYDASYDFYEDLGNNLYLFDTTFSWCIHIHTEEVYGSLDLMDIYIYIKVLNFEKMPKFMKRYKEFLIKK